MWMKVELSSVTSDVVVLLQYIFLTNNLIDKELNTYLCRLQSYVQWAVYLRSDKISNSTKLSKSVSFWYNFIIIGIVNI